MLFLSLGLGLVYLQAILASWLRCCPDLMCMDCTEGEGPILRSHVAFARPTSFPISIHCRRWWAVPLFLVGVSLFSLPTQHITHNTQSSIHLFICRFSDHPVRLVSFLSCRLAACLRGPTWTATLQRPHEASTETPSVTSHSAATAASAMLGTVRRGAGKPTGRPLRWLDSNKV